MDGWVKELDEAERAGSGSSREPPGDTEYRQVLVVDDDEVIRRLVRAGLEREGFVVRDAPDGDAALDALERCSASLVILDVNLGTVGGFDVLSRIRASSTSLTTVAPERIAWPRKWPTTARVTS